MKSSERRQENAPQPARRTAARATTSTLASTNAGASAIVRGCSFHTGSSPRRLVDAREMTAARRLKIDFATLTLAYKQR